MRLGAAWGAFRGDLGTILTPGRPKAQKTFKSYIEDPSHREPDWKPKVEKKSDSESSRKRSSSGQGGKRGATPGGSKRGSTLGASAGEPTIKVAPIPEEPTADPGTPTFGGGEFLTGTFDLLIFLKFMYSKKVTYLSKNNSLSILQSRIPN